MAPTSSQVAARRADVGRVSSRLETWGVVFDMDGVLLDSEPLQFEALNRTLEPYGVAVDLATFRTFIGIRSSDNFRELARTHGLRAELAELLARKDAIYQELLAARLASGALRPRPGLRGLLARLRRRGVRLAVASSSGRADIALVLRAFRIAPPLGTIVSGEECRHSKPDPEIYLRAAAELGLPPARLVAIEDSGPGVAAALAAGYRVVACPTEFTAPHAELAGAHLRVPSLEAVSLRALRELVG